MIKTNIPRKAKHVEITRKVALASDCRITAVAPERVVLIGNNLESTLQNLKAVENKTQRQLLNIATINDFNKADNISTKSKQFCKVVLDREIGNFSNNTTEKGGADLDRAIKMIIRENENFTKGIDKFCAILNIDFKKLVNNVARNMQDGFNHQSNRSDNKQGLYIDIKGLVKLIQGIVSLGKNDKFYTDLFGDSILLELNKFNANEQIFNKSFVIDMNQWYGTSSYSTHLAQIKSILKSFEIITLSENNRSFSLTDEGKNIINTLSLSFDEIKNRYQKMIANRIENAPIEYRGKLRF